MTLQILLFMALGDFNCVLGAHEKRGGNPPSVSSCVDFQRMMSDCNLIDIPTRGLSYTWTDRRTYVWLDRYLGNMEWLSLITARSCFLVLAWYMFRNLLSNLETCGCLMMVSWIW